MDAKKVANFFVKNNNNIINNPKKADLIIVFTCAIFDIVAKESLQKVKELNKYPGELIVAGCLPEIKKEELEKIFNGRCIVSKDIENFDKLFPNNKIKFKDVDDANTFFVNYYNSKPFNISFINSDSSQTFVILNKYLTKIGLLNQLFIKIQNHIIKNFYGGQSIAALLSKEKISHIRISSGCPNNCSYCTIKKAVGSLKSKPVNECIKEFKEGVNQGYKIFRILADDVGSYGLDIRHKFPDLLKEIIKIPGDYKIVISDLNPKWAVKYKEEIKEILKSKKIIRIDIPIQSGNTRILKLMHRYSNIEEINETISEFLEVFPDLIIETHCIVGFPTETWNEFISSLDFIQKNNIYSGYILQYSHNKNTVAGTIKHKISKKEMNRRIKYAKKFLKNLGYIAIYIPKRRNLRFDKREK